MFGSHATPVRLGQNHESMGLMSGSNLHQLLAETFVAFFGFTPFSLAGEMEEPLDYTDKSRKLLWHGSKFSRLRVVSFTAEAFWKLAFKERRGLNGIRPGDVSKLLLSQVSIDGDEAREREVKIPLADALAAHGIAVAVVERLESQGYRILDAVLPALVGGVYKEHDLIVERKGLPMRSSVEVKCRTIRKPEAFSERLAVFLEFPGECLEDGWRYMYIDKYDASGQWLRIGEFSGQARPASSGASVACKRPASADWEEACLVRSQPQPGPESTVTPAPEQRQAPPAAQPVVVFRAVIPQRKSRLRRHPRSWGEAKGQLAFFDATPSCRVCLASDLLFVLHRDNNHVAQEKVKWRKAVGAIRDANHCFILRKPYSGRSGSAPLVLTEEAAREVAVQVYELAP